MAAVADSDVAAGAANGIQIVELSNFDAVADLATLVAANFDIV